jgi:hypothetical protein
VAATKSKFAGTFAQEGDYALRPLHRPRIIRANLKKVTLVKRKSRKHLREVYLETTREVVMARLARKIGRGRDAIYHGTRFPTEVLRSGKLKPDPSGKISFSRSPEVAAYFAFLLGDGIIRWTPAVLVLDRSSLTQTYRLDPWRYDEDWDDEREEVVWGRTIDFRKHLLGVVREADVDKIISPDEGKLVRAARAKVREIIVEERKRLRLRTATPADRAGAFSIQRQNRARAYPARCQLARSES